MLKSPRRNLLVWLLGASCALSAGAQGYKEELTPFLTRVDPQEWLFRTNIALSANNLAPANDGPLLTDEEFKIEQGTIFFPMPMRSASHDRDFRTIKAKLLFEGREVPLKLNMVAADSGGNPLHSGEAYGTWTFGPIEAAYNMIFEVEARATCWNTEFKDAEAMTVPWPAGAWPKEAASTFEPELFINEGFEGTYDTDFVERLADRWTKGKAKSQPPMVVAKYLAGEVAKSFQPSGSGIVPDARPATARQSAQSVGATSAFEVLGAEEAAKRGKGTAFDMPLLLVAVYREVGLPARLVFGYVGGSAGGGAEAFRASDRAEVGPYAWVEVALYDEKQADPRRQLTWVPVDINRIRADRAFSRKLDQPWPGFGSSDKLNEIIPIAYHLHPHRMGADSYGATIGRKREPMPSLWGWNIVPSTPCGVDQVLTFTATSPSRGPGDPEPGRRDRGQ
ncbi:MAG: transglutaminase domain-containing protein [Phycisphaerales bacterium]|nr:transglutaminase domain-containing protein [Phycisphaerales bacterium]MCB9836410.1 transglutaminase domain-containing protein [Phycisphaera sp.]